MVISCDSVKIVPFAVYTITYVETTDVTFFNIYILTARFHHDTVPSQRSGHSMTFLHILIYIVSLLWYWYGPCFNIQFFLLMVTRCNSLKNVSFSICIITYLETIDVIFFDTIDNFKFDRSCRTKKQLMRSKISRIREQLPSTWRMRLWSRKAKMISLVLLSSLND